MNTSPFKSRVSRELKSILSNDETKLSKHEIHALYFIGTAVSSSATFIIVIQGSMHASNHCCDLAPVYSLFSEYNN